MKGLFIVLVIISCLSAVAFSATPVGFYESCSATVVKDPIFTGFHGQLFEFDGKPDVCYSIFNDEFTNLNAKFDKSNHKSHKFGTVMKEFGLIIGKTPFIIIAESKKTHSVEITVNGSQTEITDRDQVEIEGCIELSYSAGKLIISTPKHQFTISFEKGHSDHISVTYMNVQITYPIEDDTKVRGILGQTANANAQISKSESSFIVSSLLASDSKSGIYSPADATSSCSFETADVNAKVRDAQFHVRSTNCIIPSPAAPISMKGLAGINGVPMGSTDPRRSANGLNYYIPNNINTLSEFSYLSKLVTDTTFEVQITSEKGADFNPFSDGPFFDLNSNQVYFVRDKTTLNVEFVATLTLSWKYVDSPEKLSVNLQFCPEGQPRCSGSIDPVATPRVHVRGETCDITDNEQYKLSDYSMTQCANDADGNPICVTSLMCRSTGANGLSYSTSSYERSYCSSKGVCSRVTLGCVIGSTPILMADGGSKPAESLSQGDLIMGSNGQPAVVFRVNTRTLDEGRLVSINQSPPFATPDHPFESSEDSNNLMVAEIDLALNLMPSEAKNLRQMVVGSSISAWDPVEKAYKPTIITSLQFVKYPTNTKVYAIYSIPINPTPSYFFGGFTVYGYSTSPSVFHMSEAEVNYFFSTYVAKEIKQSIDDAFAKQSNVADINAFSYGLGLAMATDVNSFLAGQITHLAADTKSQLQHSINWDKYAKELVHPLELFILNPSTQAAQATAQAAKMQLSGLYKADPQAAHEFVDHQLVHFVKNWIAQYSA